MTDYQFTTPVRFSRGSTGPWVRVSEGGLPVPVELRISPSSDGRRIVTGLVINEACEITSNTLRSIRLGEILAALFDFQVESDDPFRCLKPAIIAGVTLAELDAAAPVQTRSRYPQSEHFAAFARTYLAEMARNPHRAMTAAARAHGISRTTANRWAAKCRELGYLPEGETR